MLPVRWQEGVENFVWVAESFLSHYSSLKTDGRKKTPMLFDAWQTKHWDYMIMKTSAVAEQDLLSVNKDLHYFSHDENMFS